MLCDYVLKCSSKSLQLDCGLQLVEMIKINLKKVHQWSTKTHDVARDMWNDSHLLSNLYIPPQKRGKYHPLFHVPFRSSVLMEDELKSIMIHFFTETALHRLIDLLNCWEWLFCPQFMLCVKAAEKMKQIQIHEKFHFVH